MNLAATIFLLAGGPGSGCRGSNCGRKVFSKLDKNWAKEVKLGRVKHKKVPINSLRGFPPFGFARDTPQYLKEVSEQTVKRRSNEMLSGKNFAPPVVWPRGGRHHVLDGIHRIAAFRKAFPNEKFIHTLVVQEKAKKAIRNDMRRRGYD